VAYRMNRAAQAELNDILIYWLRASRDKTKATRLERSIRAKCRQLGTNVETGTPYDGTPCRVGYAVEARFSIYYLVLGPRSIDVLSVRDNKQPRPLPEELTSRTNLAVLAVVSPPLPSISVPVAAVSPVPTPAPVTAASTSAIIEGRLAPKKRAKNPTSTTRGKAHTGPRWFLVYEADENVKFRPFDTLEEALDTVRFSSSAYKIFEAVDRQEATSKWEKFLLRTTKGQDFWDRPENPAVSRRGGK